MDAKCIKLMLQFTPSEALTALTALQNALGLLPEQADSRILLEKIQLSLRECYDQIEPKLHELREVVENTAEAYRLGLEQAESEGWDTAPAIRRAWATLEDLKNAPIEEVLERSDEIEPLFMRINQFNAN